jgi:hypothetical protein
MEAKGESFLDAKELILALDNVESRISSIQRTIRMVFYSSCNGMDWIEESKQRTSFLETKSYYSEKHVRMVLQLKHHAVAVLV